MIYLDTSFLVRALVPDSSCSGLLETWLANRETVNMSSVAWAEFMCGPLDPHVGMSSRELLTVISPLTEADADLAAEIFNGTGRRRNSFTDCLIAATAIHNDGVLATRNERDFSRFTGFGLELIG